MWKWDEAEKFYYGRIINRIGIAIMMALMVPSVAIAVTWNTLPGEKFYPVKRTLEKIALMVVGDNFELKTEVQAQLVAQRFEESQAVTSSDQMVVALAELSTQVEAAKLEILVRNENSNEAVTKEKAAKLAKKLKEYEAKLESQKSTRSEPVQANPNPATLRTTVETSGSMNTVPMSTPAAVIPTVPIATLNERQSGVEQQIDVTQAVIHQAIEDLEEVESENYGGIEINRNNRENQSGKEKGEDKDKRN